MAVGLAFDMAFVAGTLFYYTGALAVWKGICNVVRCPCAKATIDSVVLYSGEVTSGYTHTIWLPIPCHLFRLSADSSD